MTLSPLRSSDPACGEYSAGFISRQAARPESWRERWPDDPGLLKVREVISRIFQRQYGFKTDAFLPDDELAAIWDMGDEFNDPLETIVEVQEAFDIKIDDDVMLEFYYGTGMTYLEFAKFVLVLAGSESERGLGNTFLLPLSLPDDYYRKGRWTWWRKFPVIGRDSCKHTDLRWRQSRRPANWADCWADDPVLIDLRDEVSRFLCERLGWPNQAFMPDDQLAALFHCKHGREYIPAVLAGFNREYGTNLDTYFIIKDGRTYLDLLRHIQAGQNR